MIFLTLFIFNISIGMGLIFAGLPTIQAIYFSAFTTFLLGQIIIYLLETKRANTHTPTKVNE
ncbi:hypothetical protein NGB24_07100 [Mammaliicoccus vitulinus]|uniref:hypothetical protein n=1 Tax=Mammaliicoccus vitulinus TaxID=71237 RepID=UPI002DB8F6F7|nr:hypothetical protein [Mammaliicoccus vitulinus]MEB7657619.1 hypothetical protein [Mammaliicoccus vitulinus]